MPNPAATETAKSGVIGALWAIALHTWTYLSGLGDGWDVGLFDLSVYMEPIEAYLAAGGIGAAWWRNRPSPSADVPAKGAAREALERAPRPAGPIMPEPRVVKPPAHVAGPYAYGKRSLQVLAELHPDLQRVMVRALTLTPYDIALICGSRTEAEQRVLVATGKSQTMDSMHCREPSHAVDIMVYGPDGPTWQVEPYYRDVNDAIREAAVLEGVELTHGIDWTSLVDAGHIELRRSAYPDVQLA